MQPTQPTQPTQRQQIRKQMRQSRNATTTPQRQQAAQQVAQRLRRHVQFQHAQHVGLYVDDFAELPTRALFRLCQQQRKQMYLPCVSRLTQQLRFVRVSWAQLLQRRMYRHRLGMLEPRQSRGYGVKKIDLLIMPLLATDAHGTRLGMGGGFYDRTLADAMHTPYRMGLGYGFQYLPHHLPQLPRQAWDQSLDALLTPQAVYGFRRNICAIRRRPAG